MLVYIYIYICGGFLKWWYPQIIQQFGALKSIETSGFFMDPPF